jgi:hypothetical protein
MAFFKPVGSGGDGGDGGSGDGGKEAWMGRLLLFLVILATTLCKNFFTMGISALICGPLASQTPQPTKPRALGAPPGLGRAHGKPLHGH